MTAVSICVVNRSMVARSAPATLMPTGLLMPVANMSMRLRMGGTQTLESPGTLTMRSSSSTSLSGVMPARHWSRGLNWMVVSNISSGAGSVAVSARPAFPKTVCTSGTVLMSLSVCWSNCDALETDRPGNADGMYSRSPSSSAGMNSAPRRLAGMTVTASTAAATRSVAFGNRSTASNIGR